MLSLFDFIEASKNLDNKLFLSKEDKEDVTRLLTNRCRKETKEKVRNSLDRLYCIHNQTIFTGLIIIPKISFHSFQSRTDEIRYIREVLLGKKK